MPFTVTTVPAVDIAGGRIVVDPPQVVQVSGCSNGRLVPMNHWRASVLTIFPDMSRDRLP